MGRVKKLPKLETLLAGKAKAKKKAQRGPLKPEQIAGLMDALVTVTGGGNCKGK